MRVLRAHHINKLLTVVEELAPEPDVSEEIRVRGGRPMSIRRNEVVALLVFSFMVAPQKTLKDILVWAQAHYYRRFRLPSYPTWVRHCHEALGTMLTLFGETLSTHAAVRFMDSTMLAVCKLVRADRH